MLRPRWTCSHKETHPFSIQAPSVYPFHPHPSLLFLFLLHSFPLHTFLSPSFLLPLHSVPLFSFSISTPLLSTSPFLLSSELLTPFLPSPFHFSNSQSSFLSIVPSPPLFPPPKTITKLNQKYFLNPRTKLKSTNPILRQHYPPPLHSPHLPLLPLPTALILHHISHPASSPIFFMVSLLYSPPPHPPPPPCPHSFLCVIRGTAWVQG